jgi:hypothetical protein
MQGIGHVLKGGQHRRPVLRSRLIQRGITRPLAMNQSSAREQGLHQSPAGAEHHHQKHDDQHALAQREGDDGVHEEAGAAAWSMNTNLDRKARYGAPSSSLPHSPSITFSYIEEQSGANRIFTAAYFSRPLLALGRGGPFCLGLVAQLGAINRGAMSCPADCRAAYPSDPWTMRTTNGHVSWGHCQPRRRCQPR